MGRLIDLTGQQMGRLRVLKRAAGHPTRWWCRCECGNKKAILGAHLRSGEIESCGCLRRERASARGRERAGEISKAATTHGLSQHPLYRAWAGIVTRCENPNSPRYRSYGARGVYMCSEWRGNPAAFIEWAIEAGWTPGLVCARYGDSGPYAPNNCRFITRSENSLEAAARFRTSPVLRRLYREGRIAHPSTLVNARHISIVKR